MNDDFMTQLREAPRAEFADALYERISRESKSRFTQPWAQRLTFRNAVVVLALLFFVAACVYAVVDRGWRRVGGIWVQVERTQKIHIPPQPSEVPDGENMQSQETECMSVAEAKEIVRFDFRVPTWAPEGFTLDDKMCGVEQFSDYADLFWAGPNEFTGISMMARSLKFFNMATQKYETTPPTVWFPVGPGSYEEARVNGQPAVLVRGDWEHWWLREDRPTGEVEMKWDENLGLQLHWADSDVMYVLLAPASVSAEDLIKMAESAK